MEKFNKKKALTVSKPRFDALKAQKEKYDKNVKILEQFKQDKWVPAPIFIETEEEKKNCKN